jgi:sialic acid synthase SpsE
MYQFDSAHDIFMNKKLAISISRRKIGPDFAPFVIVEIGINHEGSMEKAKRMIDNAATAGAECVKFQSHVVDDEMVPEAKKTIPANAKESIWDIMARCAFSEAQERELKKYTESRGMIYLCTPFSRAAADRLHRMNVAAYKIGSGECNNYPLIEHIASFKKPVILSTGMNTIASIKPAVAILRKAKVPFAILHCTNMYPTPYNDVRLGALTELQKAFPGVVTGLSCHSLGIYTGLAAVALGGSIVEKHFTSDKSWPGPDVAISIDPAELQELIKGTRAIWEARGGKKGPAKGEAPTIAFAFASVVSIKPIRKGERFTKENLWVKRPGTGEIKAMEYKKILGKKARADIASDAQLRRVDIG